MRRGGSSQDVAKDGYSRDSFGAHSYKEVLNSPGKAGAVGNGSDNPPNLSNGYGYHNGGRIWILCQPKSFRVQFLEYNAQFIHMKGYLRRLAGNIVGPWAIAGDFNCVLAANERVGGNVPSSEMEPFRDCVADCGVLDIAATGALYTWNNKQKPEERIYIKLDRVLVNKDWCDHLHDLYAHFLPEGMYDHTPCIVSSNKQMQDKRERMQLLKPALRQLNISDIENAADVKQKKIEDLQVQLGRDPSDLQMRADESEAAAQLKELTAARDNFLSQKAKHKWIQNGDSNSAFFHGLLKQRKHGNKVFRMEDTHGRVCDKPEQIQNAFLEYYKELLGSNHSIGKVHRSIIEQRPKCSPEDCA
ncbi:uncharacterized protein LOC141632219 [Silene latifolia]|uniref:uncharacterized protein LOC141632219 n=1 Tax=Silene latifolia TaxID=37657 RepID=UPI003D785646